MALPVDFEEKIKLPAQVNGGYPYSIKAEDLMDNFKYCVIETDSSGTDDVILTIEKETDGTRRIRALLTNPLPAAFPGGGNLNMRVDNVFLNLSANTIHTVYATRTHCWRNGVYLGEFDIGAEPEGTAFTHFSTYVSGC